MCRCVDPGLCRCVLVCVCDLNNLLYKYLTNILNTKLVKAIVVSLFNCRPLLK